MKKETQKPATKGAATKEAKKPTTKKADKAEAKKADALVLDNFTDEEIPRVIEKYNRPTVIHIFQRKANFIVAGETAIDFATITGQVLTGDKTVSFPKAKLKSFIAKVVNAKEIAVVFTKFEKDGEAKININENKPKDEPVKKAVTKSTSTKSTATKEVEKDERSQLIIDAEQEIMKLDTLDKLEKFNFDKMEFTHRNGRVGTWKSNHEDNARPWITIEFDDGGKDSITYCDNLRRFFRLTSITAKKKAVKPAKEEAAKK